MTEEVTKAPAAEGPRVNRLPKSPGRPKGVVETKPRRKPGEPLPRIPKRAKWENAALVDAAAQKHLQNALQCLGRAAEEDPAAAEKFIRLVAPPAPPRVFLSGAGHIANLPAEERLAALTAMVTRGEIDIAGAAALSGMIRAEIEFRYVKPLKQAVQEMESAVKSGDRKSYEDALFRLSKALGLAHTRTVEGEIVDG